MIINSNRIWCSIKFQSQLGSHYSFCCKSTPKLNLPLEEGTISGWSQVRNHLWHKFSNPSSDQIANAYLKAEIFFSLLSPFQKFYDQHLNFQKLKKILQKATFFLTFWMSILEKLKYATHCTYLQKKKVFGSQRNHYTPEFLYLLKNSKSSIKNTKR